MIQQGAAITIDLPAASGVTNRIYTIKRIGNTATVTVDADGSEEIDGATTYDLTAKNGWVKVICDGSNWYIIGEG